jgi:hypothetical protein
MNTSSVQQKKPWVQAAKDSSQSDVRRFDFRFRRGSEFEHNLSSHIEAVYDCSIFPWGMSQYNAPLQKALHSSKSGEAQFARFQPDFIVSSAQSWLYLDAKSSIRDSDFYSVSLEEFRFQKSLVQEYGLKLILAFPPLAELKEFRAQYIQRIDIERTIKDSQTLSLCNGSRLDFGLIRKANLPALSVVLDELIPRRDGLNVESFTSMPVVHISALYGPRGLKV